MMSDAQIAQALRHGSSEAFGALYLAHGKGVLAYLTRLTGRREMAEELTQETFLTALRKIAFFRPGPADGGLKAWIYRIGTHLALDQLRREARLRPLPEHWDEPAAEDLAPDTELVRHQLGHAIAQALAQLTDAQRTVFLLKEQEGLSLLEISRVCGASENAIKQGLFRARAALRSKLCLQE